MTAVANNPIVTRTLFTAGTIGVLIGLLMLLTPVAFHGTAGISLGPDKSLLNEMRAAGGGVLVSGLFVLAGAFRTELTFASAILAALVYLANGLARFFSMVVDGPPSDLLMIVAAGEISMGLACAYALTKVRI